MDGFWLRFTAKMQKTQVVTMSLYIVRRKKQLREDAKRGVLDVIEQ